MIIDFYGVRPRKEEHGVDLISDAVKGTDYWDNTVFGGKGLSHSFGHASHRDI